MEEIFTTAATMDMPERERSNIEMAAVPMLQPLCPCLVFVPRRRAGTVSVHRAGNTAVTKADTCTAFFAARANWATALDPLAQAFRGLWHERCFVILYKKPFTLVQGEWFLFLAP
ncbi:MAG: hypothetical protein PW845_21325 [Pseudomonas sp.]|nr:hypothetical protein [Pseudomonas sp.]